jgi:midasin (ATPase involved in ribosome maturation)
VDLVIIDGAPGVEKRSVVAALARLTGYRLFDNDISISIDWALTVCSWECYQLQIRH